MEIDRTSIGRQSIGVLKGTERPVSRSRIISGPSGRAADEAAAGPSPLAPSSERRRGLVAADAHVFGGTEGRARVPELAGERGEPLGAAAAAAAAGVSGTPNGARPSTDDAGGRRPRRRRARARLTRRHPRRRVIVERRRRHRRRRRRRARIGIVVGGAPPLGARLLPGDAFGLDPRRPLRRRVVIVDASVFEGVAEDRWLPLRASGVRAKKYGRPDALAAYRFHPTGIEHGGRSTRLDGSSPFSDPATAVPAADAAVGAADAAVVRRAAQRRRRGLPRRRAPLEPSSPHVRPSAGRVLLERRRRRRRRHLLGDLSEREASGVARRIVLRGAVDPSKLGLL